MKRPSSRLVRKPQRCLTGQDLVAVKGGGTTEQLYGAYDAADTEVKVWQDDWLAPV